MTYALLLIYVFMSPILPWSLVISLATVIHELVPLPTSFLIILGLGLVEDLIWMRPMGMSSLVLTTALLLSWLLHHYYRAFTLGWMVIISIFGQVIWCQWGNVPWRWWYVLGQVITVIVLYRIRKKLFDSDGIYVGF